MSSPNLTVENRYLGADIGLEADKNYVIFEDFDQSGTSVGFKAIELGSNDMPAVGAEPAIIDLTAFQSATAVGYTDTSNWPDQGGDTGGGDTGGGDTGGGDTGGGDTGGDTGGGDTGGGDTGGGDTGGGDTGGDTGGGDTGGGDTGGGDTGGDTGGGDTGGDAGGGDTGGGDTGGDTGGGDTGGGDTGGDTGGGDTGGGDTGGGDTGGDTGGGDTGGDAGGGDTGGGDTGGDTGGGDTGGGDTGGDTGGGDTGGGDTGGGDTGGDTGGGDTGGDAGGGDTGGGDTGGDTGGGDTGGGDTGGDTGGGDTGGGDTGGGDTGGDTGGGDTGGDTGGGDTGGGDTGGGDTGGGDTGGDTGGGDTGGGDTGGDTGGGDTGGDAGGGDTGGDTGGGDTGGGDTGGGDTGGGDTGGGDTGGDTGGGDTGGGDTGGGDTGGGDTGGGDTGGGDTGGGDTGGGDTGGGDTGGDTGGGDTGGGDTGGDTGGGDTGGGDTGGGDTGGGDTGGGDTGGDTGGGDTGGGDTGGPDLISANTYLGIDIGLDEAKYLIFEDFDQSGTSVGFKAIEINEYGMPAEDAYPVDIALDKFETATAVGYTDTSNWPDQGGDTGGGDTGGGDTGGGDTGGGDTGGGDTGGGDTGGGDTGGGDTGGGDTGGGDTGGGDTGGDTGGGDTGGDAGGGDTGGDAGGGDTGGGDTGGGDTGGDTGGGDTGGDAGGGDTGGDTGGGDTGGGDTGGGDTGGGDTGGGDTGGGDTGGDTGGGDTGGGDTGGGDTGGDTGGGDTGGGDTGGDTGGGDTGGGDTGGDTGGGDTGGGDTGGDTGGGDTGGGDTGGPDLISANTYLGIDIGLDEAKYLIFEDFDQSGTSVGFKAIEINEYGMPAEDAYPVDIALDKFETATAVGYTDTSNWPDQGGDTGGGDTGGGDTGGGDTGGGDTGGGDTGGGDTGGGDTGGGDTGGGDTGGGDTGGGDTGGDTGGGDTGGDAGGGDTGGGDTGGGDTGGGDTGGDTGGGDTGGDAGGGDTGGDAGGGDTGGGDTGGGDTGGDTGGGDTGGGDTGGDTGGGDTGGGDTGGGDTGGGDTGGGDTGGGDTGGGDTGGGDTGGDTGGGDTGGGDTGGDTGGGDTGGGDTGGDTGGGDTGGGDTGGPDLISANTYLGIDIGLDEAKYLIFEDFDQSGTSVGFKAIEINEYGMPAEDAYPVDIALDKFETATAVGYTDTSNWPDQGGDTGGGDTGGGDTGGGDTGGDDTGGDTGGGDTGGGDTGGGDTGGGDTGGGDTGGGDTGGGDTGGGDTGGGDTGGDTGGGDTGGGDTGGGDTGGDTGGGDTGGDAGGGDTGGDTGGGDTGGDTGGGDTGGGDTGGGDTGGDTGGGDTGGGDTGGGDTGGGDTGGPDLISANTYLGIDIGLDEAKYLIFEDFDQSGTSVGFKAIEINEYGMPAEDAYPVDIALDKFETATAVGYTDTSNWPDQGGDTGGGDTGGGDTGGGDTGGDDTGGDTGGGDTGGGDTGGDTGGGDTGGDAGGGDTGGGDTGGGDTGGGDTGGGDTGGGDTGGGDTGGGDTGGDTGGGDTGGGDTGGGDTADPISIHGHYSNGDDLLVFLDMLDGSGFDNQNLPVDASVTVKIDGETLTEDTDYTIEFHPAGVSATPDDDPNDTWPAYLTISSTSSVLQDEDVEVKFEADGSSWTTTRSGQVDLKEWIISQHEDGNNSLYLDFSKYSNPSDELGILANTSTEDQTYKGVTVAAGTIRFGDETVSMSEISAAFSDINTVAVEGTDGHDYFNAQGFVSQGLHVQVGWSPGEDQVIGGLNDNGGYNNVEFSASELGYRTDAGVNLDNSTLSLTIANGNDSTVIENIGGFFGTEHDDVFIGSDFRENFITQGGNDTITGGGGDDRYFIDGSATITDYMGGEFIEIRGQDFTVNALEGEFTLSFDGTDTSIAINPSSVTSGYDTITLSNDEFGIWTSKLFQGREENTYEVGLELTQVEYIGMVPGGTPSFYIRDSVLDVKHYGFTDNTTVVFDNDYGWPGDTDVNENLLTATIGGGVTTLSANGTSISRSNFVELSGEHEISYDSSFVTDDGFLIVKFKGDPTAQLHAASDIDNSTSGNQTGFGLEVTGIDDLNNSVTQVRFYAINASGSEHEVYLISGADQSFDNTNQLVFLTSEIDFDDLPVDFGAPINLRATVKLATLDDLEAEAVELSLATGNPVAEVFATFDDGVNPGTTTLKVILDAEPAVGSTVTVGTVVFNADDFDKVTNSDGSWEGWQATPNSTQLAALSDVTGKQSVKYDEDPTDGDGSDIIDGADLDFGDDWLGSSGSSETYTIAEAVAVGGLAGKHIADNKENFELVDLSDLASTASFKFIDKTATDITHAEELVLKAFVDSYNYQGSISDSDGEVFNSGTFTSDYNSVVEVHVQTRSDDDIKGVQLSTDGSNTYDAATESDGEALFAFNTNSSDLIVNGALPGTVSAIEDAINSNDALDVLKMVVGLDTSTGTPDAAAYIAADFDGNGTVNSMDALAILKYSLEIAGTPEPEWVFVDENADLSGISRGAVSYTEGLNLDDTNISFADHLNITAILVGDVDDSLILASDGAIT